MHGRAGNSWWGAFISTIDVYTYIVDSNLGKMLRGRISGTRAFGESDGSEAARADAGATTAYVNAMSSRN
jgi:hypothetical protein